MNLKKVKNDISKLKKDIGVDDEPNIFNFFKFCERYYGRKVDMGELWFDTYWIGQKKVKSNPLLFIRLSEKYFKDMHNVMNPIKEGKHSLKSIATLRWNDIHYKKHNPKLEKKTMNEDEEFNKWFESAWQDIIENGDFAKYSEMRYVRRSS